MNSIKSSILALILLATLSARGQRHAFLQYSVQEGLAQSQVRDIIQSDDGHLWIATIGGVSRFDGKSFTNFNKANGLLNNVITAIYQSQSHGIVIACQGGLVTIKNNQVRTFPFPSQWSETVVFDMQEFDNQLALASNGQGLIFWDGNHFEADTTLPDRYRFIRSLDVQESTLLLGTKKGLVSWSVGTTNALIDKVSVNKVLSNSARTWVATTRNGIYGIGPNDTIHLGTEEGLTSQYQKDLCLDAAGNLWSISKNSIVKFNPQTGQLDEIKSTEKGVLDNLKVIYYDLEGTLWVGTSGAGILKFTGEQSVIYTVLDGMSSDQIMNIATDHEGKLWFASYGGGVMNKSEQSFETIDHKNGLLNNTVWSLERVDEAIWIGTSDGINIWRDGHLHAFGNNDSLPFARASVIHLDGQGAVWVGTRDGLVRIINGHIETPPALASLNLVEVKAIEEIGDHLWVSSRYGAYGYNLVTGEIQHIHKETGLEDDYVSSLAKDPHGGLWLGTDEGVYRYHQGNLQHINVSEKPSSNIVNFLVHDSLQSLWIGTDHGLFSLNTSVLQAHDSVLIRSYNEHDGIISAECNQNAGYCDSSGILWFGTNGGLVSMDPARLSPFDREITNLKLSDLEVNFESILEDSILGSERLSEFSYQNNRFTFRFNAVHFSNPEKIWYRYRLLGSDDKWSPPVQENAVTYAGLPPGEYTFEAMVKVENSRWAQPTALFRFVINPPFYRTWWFILLCAIAIGLIVWMIITSYQTQQNRKRQLVEAENQAKILGLEQQTLNAHMNRHFIFNALNSIQYYINTQDKKMANTYLTSFASLVRKNLDSAQVESINLKDELERLRIYMNLEQMRFQDRFTYEFEVDPKIDTENTQVPSMILQPFIENSIMHGILPTERQGHIQIKIAREEELLLFEIKDNGIGVETSVKRKNGVSLHVSNGMKITRQRLELLRSMTKLGYGVDGPLELRDENNATLGTVVRVTLPVTFQSKS